MVAGSGLPVPAQRQGALAAASACALAGVFAAMLALFDLAGHLAAAIALGLAAGIFYFIALFLLEHTTDRAPTLWIILAGALLFRALLFPTPPTLSDDVHRYRWEAQMQLAGLNPYAVRPDDPRTLPLRDESWRTMPGREIATIYPPLVELSFRKTWRGLSGLPLSRQIIWFKLPYVAADLLIAALLAWHVRRSGGRNYQVAMYAWNPLVIVEFAGSGHMDPLAIAALFIATLLLMNQRDTASTVMLAAGALCKVFPLALAPLWLRRSGWPRRAQSWLGVAGAVGLAAASWWPYRGGETELLRSLAYHESRWQQNNASLYTFLRWASGSHEFAAGIGAGVLLALALWVTVRNLEPLRAIPALLAVMLLFSPNAFPWYFTWAIPFLCLAPWNRLTRAWLALTVTQFMSYHVLLKYNAHGLWQFEPLSLWLVYAPFFLLLCLPVSREAGSPAR